MAEREAHGRQIIWACYRIDPEASTLPVSICLCVYIVFHMLSRICLLVLQALTSLRAHRSQVAWLPLSQSGGVASLQSGDTGSDSALFSFFEVQRFSRVPSKKYPKGRWVAPYKEEDIPRIVVPPEGLGLNFAQDHPQAAVTCAWLVSLACIVAQAVAAAASQVPEEIYGTWRNLEAVP